jgi:hypothetical protein
MLLAHAGGLSFGLIMHLAGHDFVEGLRFRDLV